jgi:hypothetical protein
MSGFEKVDLGNYEASVIVNSTRRTIVIVSESKEAAASQAVEFAKHLHESQGLVFDDSETLEVRKLECFHVTYTEAAWETLKSS